MSRLTVIQIVIFLIVCTGCERLGPQVVEVDRVFTEANRLYSAGKLREAEEKYEWVVRHASENPRPYNNLGNLYARQGVAEKAEAQYQKALDLNPGYLVARINLAVLSLKQGSTEHALGLLEDGLREYPENSDLLSGLGICEIRKGNIKKAIRYFRKAIDIQGASPRLYNNLAFAYAESNEYLNEALKLSKEALKADSENAVYLDTLGWIYFKRGVFEQSIEYLNMALEKQPRSEAIRSHLVKVYRWLGRDDKAVELIKDGIRVRVMSQP